MVKYHSKRIALPRTWGIPRKSVDRVRNMFVTRPSAGKSHMTTMAANTIIKELIKLVPTTREVKSILRTKHVLVNGNRIRDEKFPIGLFDVIEFQELGRQFRVILSPVGKLAVLEIDAKEKSTHVRQVLGKTLLKKGTLQLHLSGSNNLLLDKNAYSIGDSLLFTDGKVSKTFTPTAGNCVLLIAGRHRGSIGTIVEVKDQAIFLDVQGSQIQTLKKYAYIVGDKKPAIAIQ